MQTYILEPNLFEQYFLQLAQKLDGARGATGLAMWPLTSKPFLSHFWASYRPVGQPKHAPMAI
jgi:hypothetical protein